MPDQVGVKITQKQFATLSQDLSLDLTALFNVIQEDVEKLLKQARKEEWTPEQLITQIENLI